MYKNFVCCRKSLFATYVGLILGGYNLTDIDKTNGIHQSISQIECDDAIRTYFRMSKTISCDVNPYWPRAFLLALAGFYVNDDFSSYHDFQEVVRHINNLDNLNPKEKSVELFNWLIQLPDYLKQISNTSLFNELWETYLNYEMGRSVHINVEVEGIVNRVRSLSGDKDVALPEIIFVPNCLQAPQVTDYIRIDNKIYIIKVIPDIESIVHEYLHEIFSIYFNDNDKLIIQYEFLLEPIFE